MPHQYKHELIARTTQMLAHVNPTLAEESAREIETRVGENTSDGNVVAEINRYWRMQVAMLDMSTFSIRECLLDDQPIEGWLRNFQQYVVPFVNTYVKSSRGGM